MGLTIEDRLDIHELYSRYAHTFDSADADGWAQVFTTDGKLVPAVGSPVVGRNALRQLCIDRNAESPNMSHHQSNVLFTAVDDDNATGAAYYHVLRVDNGTLCFRALGRYTDEIQRTDEGWKFSSRGVTPWITLEAPELPFAWTVA